MTSRLAWVIALAAAIFAIPNFAVHAAEPDPYGDAGNFNGFVIEHTVEPYNGHAYREIQDVQINGAIGRTLELRRYYNTERPGQWRTNYDWIIYGDELLLPGKLPTHYPLGLPSGGFIDFKASSTDSLWRGPAGTRERLSPITLATPTVTVTLPDGGKLVWTASLYTDPVYKGYNRYYYALTSIIDPYTVKQTVTYEYDVVSNGIPQVKAMIIKDLAGRNLRIDYLSEGTYLGDGNHLIDKVTPSDGRAAITYGYSTGVFGPYYPSYKYLSSVSYYGDATIGTAAYAMTTTYNFSSPPSLITAYDPMYSGALKTVRYSYRNVFGSDAGQIEKVMYPAQSGRIDMNQACKDQHPGSSGAVLGDITDPYSWTCAPSGAGIEISTYCVSTYGSSWKAYLGNTIDAYSWACVNGSPVDVATMAYANDDTRTVTRGDNESQTTTYHDGIKLSQTDWKGKVMSWTYDDNNYIKGYIPPGGTTKDRINYENDPLTGNVLKTTYPIDGSGVISTRIFTYEALYYLKTVTDERGKKTTYTRDPVTHRVTHIALPDGGYEDWTWNTFGESLTHTWLVSTGVTATESWLYDSRGMMTEYRDPVHRTGNPTYRYVYDGKDRLWKVTDAQGTVAGDALHTTVYLYNNRGQSRWKEQGTFDQSFVTQITHPDAKTVKYAYDADGNRTSVTNELTKKWTYKYDDYRRVTSILDPLQHETFYFYCCSGTYATTWDQPGVTVTPSGRITSQVFDANFRLIESGKASGIPGEEAYTTLEYENDGDLSISYDPLARRTFLNTYDRRHRLTNVQNIWLQDTSFTYDPAGNKTKETRSDKKSRTWNSYDAMNRVLQLTGFDGDVTKYTRNYVGNITKITDAKGAIYTSGWDLMGRMIWLIYPPDSSGVVRTERWDYDAVGNLWHHTMPSGDINTLLYDSRQRLLSSTWNVTGHDTTYVNDAASRVTNITNPVSAIVNSYDDANNLISQSQTIAGQPKRVVDTPVDADNRRSGLYLADAVNIGYNYTTRGQLNQITQATIDVPVWFQFKYDLADNRTWIENLLQGVQGGLFTQNIYDPAKDRVTRQIQWGETALSDTSIYYTEVNDKIQFTSDAMNTGHGDRFEYTSGSQQLLNATYDASDPGNPDPIDYASQEVFVVDALKRLSVTTDGVKTAFTAANDGLNQYTAVGTKIPVWGNNFRLSTYNGITFSHDVEGNLTSMSGNGHTTTLSYDGLHRLVKQVADGVTTAFTYDGWNAIAEWNVGGKFLASNIFGPDPNQILLRQPGKLRYYQYATDTRHNPVLLLDDENTIVEKYSYNAFGATTITDAKGRVRTKSKYSSALLYGGSRYFADFGVYYMQARWYMPELGQFIETDPMSFDAGDNNLYRYVSADPINQTDPSGLGPLDNFIEGFDDFDFDVEWTEAGRDLARLYIENHPEEFPNLYPQGFMYAAPSDLSGYYARVNAANLAALTGQSQLPTVGSYNGNLYDANGNNLGVGTLNSYVAPEGVGYNGGIGGISFGTNTGFDPGTGAFSTVNYSGDYSSGSWGDGAGNGGSWACAGGSCTTSTTSPSAGGHSIAHTGPTELGSQIAKVTQQ